MNNLYFNGKDLWNDFNCGILKGIQYPVVKEIIENIQVEGNIYGDLTEKTGSYEDLIQEVNVRMFGLDNYRTRVAFIEDWLSNIEDKRLFFEENLDRCLYAKNAYISSKYNKNGNNCVEFSLKFECEPFYFDSNIRTITWNKDTILKSDTMIDYEPIIELQATGAKTTIIINDKELSFDSVNGTSYIIDCEKEYVYKKGTRTPVITKGNFFKIKRGNNTFISTTTNSIKIQLKNRYRG